ncbi:MAG: TVP38/TMEM64 family protein [Desulfomicrobium apsheronum]|jgi:uncharacterized membrane protein YdjX (TVP38/TMEM64 family)|nr:TVP38/TMEM64 family protein [Desulfomicrobium apsheronum]
MSRVASFRQGRVLKILAMLLAAGLLLAAARYFDVQTLFRQALQWIADLGPTGPILFVALYIIACVLLLPGSILTLGAGVVFGLGKGFIAVSVGATLGATCAFLVGRYLARDWVAAKIAGNEKFRAVDDAVAREGWKIVFLTRLSPVFPFNILNYAFGLTKVGLKDFFLASWIGMIPGTIMYVYIGSLAGDLAGLGGGGRERTAGEWALYGVGFLATVAVTVVVTRLARKALAGKIAA